MQQSHPLRLQYELFSDRNPFMAPVNAWAEQVRGNRRPAAADNPFLAMQENASRQIVAALDAWRDISETLAERTFMAVYGSPLLQAAVGIDPDSAQRPRQAAKNPLHRQLLEKRTAELRAHIPAGGLREAIIRALLYVGMTRRAIDERGFEMARRIRLAHDNMSLSDFKALIREQFNMLLIDEAAALAAIPSMLPPDAETRLKAFDLISEILGALGDLSDTDRTRLAEIARLFGVDEKGNGSARRKPGRSKAP